jgi:predicted tellurium resistance membrane protein TerC
LSVVIIDVVLAGDNAIIVGMAAAGLHAGAPSPRHPARHRGGDGAAHPFAFVAL